LGSGSGFGRGLGLGGVGLGFGFGFGLLLWARLLNRPVVAVREQRFELLGACSEGVQVNGCLKRVTRFKHARSPLWEYLSASRKQVCRGERDSW
jgi:hypothetical protein